MLAPPFWGGNAKVLQTSCNIAGSAVTQIRVSDGCPSTTHPGQFFHQTETTEAARGGLRFQTLGEAQAFFTSQPVSSARALPMSARERTVFTPASCRAANFSSAVPLPPEMMAPAWPMRLPGGAVTPAM